jgi:hypothetical protein
VLVPGKQVRSPSEILLPCRNLDAADGERRSIAVGTVVPPIGEPSGMHMDVSGSYRLASNQLMNR